MDCGDRNNFLYAAVRIFGILHLQANELQRRGGEIIRRGLDEFDVGDREFVGAPGQFSRRDNRVQELDPARPLDLSFEDEKLEGRVGLADDEVEGLPLLVEGDLGVLEAVLDFKEGGQVSVDVQVEAVLAVHLFGLVILELAPVDLFHDAFQFLLHALEALFFADVIQKLD